MLRELPDSEKPRERLIAEGAFALSNAELIAILLGSGPAGESAVSLASRVLALERGGLQGFVDYTPQEFMRVRGIGSAKACCLAASIELGRRIANSAARSQRSLDSPSKAAGYFMEEMRSLKHEVFKVALLNVKNELISSEYVSVGGLNSSPSHPREVFSMAVKKGAYSVILVHNHPSGDPSPSEADMEITQRLCEAGEILGIRVADHIIIGDGCYVSLRKEGKL